MYNDNYSNQFTDDTPKIKVIIRKRPVSQKETKNNDPDIVDIRGAQQVVVRETKLKVDLTKYIEEHKFNFDRTFGETTTNEQLYTETVRPIVECLFQGAKVTCFAYGQTGSGKTYTMMGELKSEDRHNATPGLYLLAARDIFHLLSQPRFQHLSLYVSFYEIYCGKLHDLLNGRQQLFAREDAKQNVNIVGLSEKKIGNVNALMQTIDIGNSVRTTSATSANLDSSRSHAILQITLKDGKKNYGKMSFIDLAGSERGAVASDANKQTRMDGAEINKSLLALKECIRALDQDKKHTPFRGSKLTLVLKDSFTGNCRTVMIGNISPTYASCEHTLNTLRYADRVKELKKPPGEDNAPKSQSDLLAKQLMLPRQSNNTTKITIIDEEDNEDLMIQNSGRNDNVNNVPNKNVATKPSQVSQHNNSMNQKQNVNTINSAKPAQNQTQQPKILPQTVSSNNTKETTHHMMPPPQTNENSFSNNITTSNLMSNLLNNLRTTFNPEAAGPPRKVEESHAQNHSNNQTTGFQRSSSPFHVDSALNNKENFCTSRFQENQPRLSLGSTRTIPKDPIPNNRNNPSSGSVRERTDHIEDITVKVEDNGQIKAWSHSLKLVNLVMMEEQEEMAIVHKQYLDSMVDLIKKESVLLKDILDPMTDTAKYVENMEAALVHKMELMSVLRASLNKFKHKLKEEEEFNNKFMNIFDIARREGHRNGEIQLLEDLP